MGDALDFVAAADGGVKLVGFRLLGEVDAEFVQHRGFAAAFAAPAALLALG